MNYQETLTYMFSQLPMFQRIGAAAYKADLGNTMAILELLGNPHKKLRPVHIAGTNGKGSSSHMLASVLQEAGYKTALYTSPHLRDFRERIRIDGQMIPQEWVVNFIARYKDDFERIQPSFFEMTVGMAFLYFAENNVDIAVLETGMGGRLDSTNVVNSILSVITNIDFDHTAFLGNTLEAIAHEKAGIIKHKVPVIIGETTPETKRVFNEVASQQDAPIHYATDLVQLKNTTLNSPGHPGITTDVYYNDQLWITQLHTPLAGIYQLKNLKTVLTALHQLPAANVPVTDQQILKGISNVLTNTGFTGRWQILSTQPLTICDVGHNEAGITYITQQFKQINYNHLHFVLGMVNDKEIDKILHMLPQEATYYFCKANIPRGLDEKILRRKAHLAGLRGLHYTSVAAAREAAEKAAHPNDMIFIGGSTFIVAEVV